MSRALLTTRLKVSDPTAMTALETLRHRFGFGERLAGLSREELFLFDTVHAPETARRVLEDLVRRTNIFMNPNKHAWRLAVEGESAASGAAPPVDLAPAIAFLLVWTPGDGRDLIESVQHHTGTGGFAGLARGWLWCFTGGPGVDAAGLLAMARQSGELRSRSEGFLAHPAWQEHRLYATRPSLYDIASALSRDTDNRHPQESRP